VCMCVYVCVCVYMGWGKGNVRPGDRFNFR
jgi:hypothetical protein